MKTIKKDNITLLIMIIGILILASIFLPTMAFSDNETPFTGFELVFGTEFANLGSWASGNVELNILGIAAYLLPIGAIFTAIFVKKGYQISILLFAISAVLFFLMPEYTKTTVTILGSVTEIDVDWVRSFGLIIAICLSIFGVIVASAKTIK